MQKTTLKLQFKILLFFALLFTASISFSQDRSVEFHQQFNTNSLESKSEVHKVSYKNTSPFVMLSVYTKNVGFNDIVYYRLLTKSAWGEWVAFQEPHEGETIDRKVFAPIYIEQAFEDIQFKTEKPTNSNFVFRLFFPEHSKNNVEKKSLISKNATTSKTFSGCTQPAFQGRSDWCPSGNCPKSNSPSTINPTHIVVHHSAGQTTNSDFAAVVRSYWDLHVNTNGWADIGYNWLVDGNGVIYEGRGDRIRGAHSPCMNGTSTGICFIGNYETASPSSAGLQALKDFIAWDATDKNIDVTASSYASTLGANIDNISGHKDAYSINSSSCSNTLCPGVNLSSKLASIRSSVASYACYSASTNLPSIPLSFSAIRSGNTSVDIQISTVANATSYGVYKSTDNSTFSKVTESTSTTIPVTGLSQDEVYYFKVEAINSSGSSDMSEVLATIPSQNSSEFLIIDGIERRSGNANFDAIEQYDFPMTQLGRTFSSATNDAVIDGLVNLSDSKFVIWMLLDESTADETFNSVEQTLISDFINNDNGIFIVSGNEIGWDLARGTQATVADKAFYSDVLKANFIADNPTPHNYLVKDTNNLSYNLIQNPNEIIDGKWPDLIKPINGSNNTFTFDGVSSGVGVAGVRYSTSQGGVEYLTFAIESIENDTQRQNLLSFVISNYSAYLAVDDSFIKQQINLYPNPTTGLLRISNPNNLKLDAVEIFNIYGQQLRKASINNNTIDIGGFSTGVYFIKIKDITGKQGTFKVVKTE